MLNAQVPASSQETQLGVTDEPRAKEAKAMSKVDWRRAENCMMDKIRVKEGGGNKGMSLWTSPTGIRKGVVYSYT